MNFAELTEPTFLQTASQRDKEVGRVWRERMAADENDRPCYDCASRYIYQWEPCGVDSIERGVWAHDDGYDCLPICDTHHAERVAKENG